MRKAVSKKRINRIGWLVLYGRGPLVFNDSQGKPRFIQIFTTRQQARNSIGFTKNGIVKIRLTEITQ